MGRYSHHSEAVGGRHPSEHEPLTWGTATAMPLKYIAYGYYGESRDYMYCKVQRHRSGKGKWWFHRSDYNNQGYLRPIAMDGVTTVEEAMATAQVWYFIDGWQIIDVNEQQNEEN